MQKFIEPVMILLYIVVTGFFIIELLQSGPTSIRLYQYLVLAVLISAIAFRIKMYLKKQE